MCCDTDTATSVVHSCLPAVPCYAMQHALRQVFLLVPHWCPAFRTCLCERLHEPSVADDVPRRKKLGKLGSCDAYETGGYKPLLKEAFTLTCLKEAV